MDRLFFGPGQEVMDTDLLSMQKNAMIGIAALAESVLGDAGCLSGFPVTAVTTPGVFAIQLGRGFIYSLQEIDPNAYGNLGADTTRSILKTGTSLSTDTFVIASGAPATAGQSINYLVSAAFSETDGNSAAVPFVNAANTSVPLSVSQNTARSQGVVFQVTAGTAAATGSQTTPAAPAGYLPMYVITITNGQTVIAPGNIVVAPGAPFIGMTLPALQPRSLLSANGWRKYPDPNSPTGYFIEQWGEGYATQDASSVVFPIAFPNACLNVGANERAAAGTWTGSSLTPTLYGASNATLTGFTLYALIWNNGSNEWTAATGQSYYWSAKGY